MAGRQPAMNRQNEYFVPRDGIDREVITADICRYLGNDALVRPGTYENKETGQLIQGYFINAYRNLTTAMIEDLKEASRQWALERSNVNGAYRHSETHQRQQGGAGSVEPQHSPATQSYDPRYQPPPPQQVYPQAAAPFGGQPQYGQTGNYPYQPQQGGTYSPPPRMEPYGQPGPPYTSAEQPYVQGGHLRREPQPDPRINYGGPARVIPQSSVAPPQPGYTSIAPGQQYYAQPQQTQANYVPQAQVQAIDPFQGRGPGAYDEQAESPTTKTKSRSNNVAGKPAYSQDPHTQYPEDHSGRTVTPTGNVNQAPPPAAQVRRDRPDQRGHQNRHKYP